MKIILSHPFSGSVHWWFGQLRGLTGDQASKAPLLSYYRSLYGDIDSYFDVALACLVIFDEVILPPADAAFPGENGYIPELNLTSDWNYSQRTLDILRAWEDRLSADPLFKRTLRRVPRHARWMAIFGAIQDIELAQEKDAPIICSPGRKAMIDRLVELDVVPRVLSGAEVANASSRIATQLGDYVTVTGLLFRAEDLASLAAVKWNDKIRRYAAEFQRVLTSDPGQRDLGGLYDQMAVAWTSADSSDSIRAAFSAASRALSIVSLIPAAGTITGALGLGADATAAAVERRTERLRWFELGPEIRRYQALRDLETALRSRHLL